LYRSVERKSTAHLGSLSDKFDNIEENVKIESDEKKTDGRGLEKVFFRAF
jgi:hypothetical protein